MLFLLNDVVLDLSDIKLTPRLTSQRFRALSMPDILRMGQELYAEYPLLHTERRGRALRLAALIATKAPLINAALFVAPGFGCDPDEVTVRFKTLDRELMEELHQRQVEGELDIRSADRQVWRRLAA